MGWAERTIPISAYRCQCCWVKRGWEISSLFDLRQTFGIGKVSAHLFCSAVAGAGAVVMIVLLVWGFDPPDADIKFDSLVSREALREGGDAYADLSDLSAREDVEIRMYADPDIDGARAHPRTPGALVLQLPLGLVPYSLQFALASCVSVLSIAWLAAYRPRDVMFSSVLALMVVLVSAPSVVTLRFAGQSAVVGVMALLGWSLASKKHGVVGGLLIGCAATLKIYPLILVAPLLLHRKWKAAAATLGSLVFLNAVGLALPGVSAAQAAEALRKAPGLWQWLYSNGSAFRVLGEAGISDWGVLAIALGSLLAGTLLMSRRKVSTPFGWLALALLFIPLSWVSYDVVLIPAALLLVTSSSRTGKTFGIFLMALWLAPIVTPWAATWSGSLSMIARLVVVIASVSGAYFKTWSLDPLSESNVGLKPSVGVDVRIA